MYILVKNIQNVEIFLLDWGKSSKMHGFIVALLNLGPTGLELDMTS